MRHIRNPEQFKHYFLGQHPEFRPMIECKDSQRHKEFFSGVFNFMEIALKEIRARLPYDKDSYPH